MPNLFNKKILNSRIKDYSVENIDEKIEKIKSWQQSLSKIKGLNEKRLQSAFLKAIFEDILGYENSPQKEEWTLDIEATTDVDAKHPDGILGFFERIDNEEIRVHEAVIELKGPQISLDKDQKRQGTTYKSPVDQAFSYTNKLDKCKWVIVSNFMEIKLYKVGRSKEYYEVFLLDELDKIENFKRFYYLLNKNNLLSKTGESVTYKLSEKTLKKEENISVKFYNLYKNVRVNLFEHLKENNPDKEPELLLEKAQKFLDRIIFIGFCEDKGLLPNDLLHEAIQRGKKSFSPSNTAVWDQIRGVFRSIDEGNDDHNINAYNGGLFEYDNDLDGLVIENNFFEAIYKISDYDFDSDVDVNILGHIFEQSISDLEKLKSDIKDDEFDKNESKRKKDGIFYTPQYITSYIVENAIGSYLEDLKEKLGYYELPDIENAGSDSWETRYTNQHIEFYNKYEEKLKEIKVLDPACGSGAFLNQAFDYLLEEHNWLNKQRDLLKGGQSSIFALDSVQRSILKNNIFGVDLNEESVEITKLSLWLKTANKRKPLTNLDDNIKCGNSLIDDPEVVGDKAFDWDKEFKEIMGDGGFDIVVGNPPYVRIQNLPESDKQFYNKKFLSAKYGGYDIYIVFVEKGISILNKNGYLGFILPNKFFSSDYGEGLRKLLVNGKYISKIISFGDIQIFKDVSTYTCLLFLNKNDNSSFDFYEFLSEKQKYNITATISDESNYKYDDIKYGNIDYDLLRDEGWILENSEVLSIINKLQNKSKLKKYIDDIYQGVRTSANSIYLFDDFEEKENCFLVYSEEIDQNVKLEKDILRKAVKRSDMSRYILDYSRLVIYPYYKKANNEVNLINEHDLKTKYPLTYNYLKTVEDELRSRENHSFDDKEWYRYGRSQNIGKWDQKKIMIPDIVDRLTGSLDFNNYINVAAGYAISLNNDDKYKFITALLNSKLLDFYLRVIGSKLRGGYRGIYKNHLLDLPVIIDNIKHINNYFDQIYSYKKELYNNKHLKLQDVYQKYCSDRGINFVEILKSSNFKNNIYSGRATKIRDFTVNINTNIITIYADKSGSGKYEILKFEENDKYKRKYIKYYLENLTDEQLAEIGEKYNGNILKKTLQIEIPDYDKGHVVKKVVKEWESLQQEIEKSEDEIKRLDNEIDQMIYKLYDLNEEEIEIVENN